MKSKSNKIQLNAIEKISIVYAIITGIFALIFGVKENYLLTAIAYRALFVGVMIALVFVQKQYRAKVFWIVRVGFPLAIIAYWYPETYYFNENIFPNLDHVFVNLDQALFGCQPSLEFHKTFPQTWINELMNFGYLSYYFLIALAVFITLKRERAVTERNVFLILCSFFIFYITFIIIPVVGPQFHFLPPQNTIPCDGIFRTIIVTLQEMGEKPTGAFPSSHVGICLISMYLILKQSKKVFLILLPVAAILILSTVYIKAHYLVDVIGGFIAAPIFYWMSLKIYDAIKFKKQNA